MERLPGFRDFYPEPLPHPTVWSAEARHHLFAKWRQAARRYGFREYDGPPLEPLELYTAKSGEEIVGQLYNFIDKGGRAVALRPEMTPTLARMIAAHERNYKKPVKWFAIPQLFRYERQQKGRLREHFQFNADIIGESDPAADAELIALLIDTLRSFELTADDFVIRLSSRNAWQQFYAERCPDAARAYEFFQVIDKLEREEPQQSERRLAALGFSLAEVRAFIDRAQPTGELETVLRNLEARGLAAFVQIDYNVIRGLAYYTGVVFEAFDRKGEFRALAGGGRYDNLVKLISGGKVDLPCAGFGMGDVVLWELLKRRGLSAPTGGTDVYFLILKEELRSQSLSCIQRLRDAGHAVEYPLTPMKDHKQFKLITETNARLRIELQDAGVFRVADARERSSPPRELRSDEELMTFLKGHLT
jgi:histidyl-tRNA synthetase